MRITGASLDQPRWPTERRVQQHRLLPELGLGAVVLMNLEEQPADLMWLGAINTALGVPVDTPRYRPAGTGVGG